MLEAFFFLLGGGLFTAVTLVWQHVVHGARKRADAERYKSLWNEAVDLLSVEGKINDEQLKLIRPKAIETAKRLPRGEGWSEDRRKVEIARAKAGLPPADNLDGMWSEDRRKVIEARIQYGTAE